MLRRDPRGEVEVLLDGLEFANGVTLAPDESFVAVAQTGAARIDRLWPTGSAAGRRDMLADRLPGLPDNLSTAGDGTIWAALPTPATRALRVLRHSAQPIRRLLGRAAAAIDPAPDAARLLAFDPTGALVRHLSLRRCGYRMATGVREHAGTLYLGSLVERAIGVLPLPHAPNVEEVAVCG